MVVVLLKVVVAVDRWLVPKVLGELVELGWLSASLVKQPGQKPAKIIIIKNPLQVDSNRNQRTP